jgi:hypothetical protein
MPEDWLVGWLVEQDARRLVGWLVEQDARRLPED